MAGGLRALTLACGVAAAAVAFTLPGAPAGSASRRGAFGAAGTGAGAGACRAGTVALAAKKRVRKRSSESREDEEGVEYVKLPPLPSELSRSASMAELENEAAMNIDLLQGKAPPAGAVLLDAEMGSAPPSQGFVKTNKYSFDLDIELPVESESRGGDLGVEEAVAVEVAKAEAPLADGVMPLPDLKELGKRKAKRQAEDAAQPTKARIERSDIGTFTKLLELDPEADSDSTLFRTEDYDYLAAALGEGTPFVGLPNSYLQSGHLVLATLCVLCGFVTYPGFPLTELPYDIRTFLQRGLLVVYALNAAIAFAAYSKAKAVGQPPTFWAVKSFVLGGLAFNELAQIEPPTPKGSRKGGRKSREL